MGALKSGYVQVYTGDGKGKTTAALGLALRASGAGLKVYIQQFAKNKKCSEIKALHKIKSIKVSQCGSGPFIIGKPSVMDIECARRGFEEAKKIIFSGKLDLVILDEINVAIMLKLIDVNDVKRLIRRKPDTVELVLTGRGCPSAVIKAADLVTEMKEIAHPYHRKITGRRGIEY